MAGRLSLEFFSDTDYRDIPSSPGIYAFYLRPISPTSVGLLETLPRSKDHAARVRRRFSTLIDKFITLSRTSHARGVIREVGRAGHLATNFSVALDESVPTDPISGLSATIPEADLRTALMLCGRISIFAQPIYVGIALEQTLRDRYEQHRRDHSSDSSDMNTFGGRLQSQGFAWSDVVFGCMATESRPLERGTMRFLEKYFQALTRPVFSKR